MAKSFLGFSDVVKLTKNKKSLEGESAKEKYENIHREISDLQIQKKSIDNKINKLKKEIDNA